MDTLLQAAAFMQDGVVNSSEHATDTIYTVGPFELSNHQHRRAKANKRSTIQSMSRLGLTDGAISRLCSSNIKTVRKWKHRPNMEDLPRNKEPTVLTLAVKNAITELCRDQWGMSTRKIARIISAREGPANETPKISKSAVSTYLRSTDWGRVAYRQQTKPLLSAKNITDRLSFCNHVIAKHYCENTEHAKHLLGLVLFTDESIVELYPKPNPQNMRIRTSNPAMRTPIGVPKNSLKIMVAGGLSANGLTELHVVDSGATVTAKYYQEQILPFYFATQPIIRQESTPTQAQRTLFDGSSDVVFMQDGAPAHTAKTTLAILHGRFANVWSKGLWPGNSPDLNPIEHLWTILQDSVFIQPRPRTRPELIERVQEAWNSISPDLMKKLVYSFPRRILECLDKRGSHTQY